MNEYRGLKGWLIVLFFYLAWLIYASTVLIISELDIINQPLGVVMLAFTVVALISFFRKNNSFIERYYGLLGVLTVTYGISLAEELSFIISLLGTGERVYLSNFYLVVSSLAGIAIAYGWMYYLLKSQRVRNTFVN